MRHAIVPSVYLVLISDGKTLLSQRKNTGFEDGRYGLVSGHMETGERPKQALLREIQEEVGIIPQNPVLAHVMYRNCGDHERVDFFFTATGWKGKITNKEPEKCDDLSWFSLDNLPANIIPYIRSAIECVQKSVWFSEWNFGRRTFH